MPESKQKFYLTTPIYYVNARPHIGHAYTTLVADTIARRHRLLGHDTFFLTGTDEHGQKIQRSAAAAGIPPQQFTDELSAEFRNLWARMGLTNDDFIRTTEPRHQQGAQRLFALLHQRGQIYLSSYTGQYSIGEEIFVEGPPGVLGPDGKPTETVTEENFFFRLSEYQLPLLDLIESDTLVIQPESRKNEVLSFLRGPIAEAQRNAAVEPSRERSGAPSFASFAKGGSESVPPADDDTATKTATSDKDVVIPTLSSSKGKDPRISPEAPIQPGAPFISQSHREMSGNADRSPAQNESPQTSPQIAYSALGNPYVVGNLRDLSVSRSSFTWGIPVPEPAASETKQKHVMYVWLDALANYMTAVGYGSDDPQKIEQFEKYWPADLHIMAKEITRQHCIYWPAFLLALNPKLQHNPGEPTPKLSPEEHRAWAEKMLPKAVVAHGWLLFDDSKMSKSKGNIVRTETILDAFGTEVYAKQFPYSTKREQDLFAADVLRYFLLREVPFGQDGSFSFEALITRYNADLANGYGNLVSRTLSMIYKYFDGVVPDYPTQKSLYDINVKTSIEELPVLGTGLIAASTAGLIEQFNDYFEDCNFTRTIEYLWQSIAVVDRYISDKAPWKLATVQSPEAKTELVNVLYSALAFIHVATALLHPILPNATANVWTQLGLGDIELAIKNGDLKNLEWGGLKPGTKLGPLSPIFPRADKGLAQIMTDMESSNAKPTPSKLVDEKTVNTEPASTHTTDPGAPPRTSALNEENPGAQVGGAAAPGPELIKTPPHAESPASAAFANASAASTTPDTPQISIDDFVKIDLRVAQILVAERIPKADKLLRLEVDLGYERRQILSGIAEWYTPEELIGRRIVVITNLAPRKMRGLESHGMLLAASAGENAKPILATFTEDIPLGSRLR
jgi:methionyl-tRNA synthetase